ncbi:hypothetical protein T08_4901 [Trichinella sp. T8]|nr:hypothetical protein T08_4901 [Trichinella sp. T8]
MHVLPNDLHSNQCKERRSRSAIKSPLQYNRWLKEPLEQLVTKPYA